jgi:hypothetical protein
MTRSLVVALVVFTSARAAHAEPRYLGVIREELTKMGLRPTCTTLSPTRGRCQYALQSDAAGTRFDVALEYSDDSDTIYHSVNHYLSVPASSPRIGEVLRRLMQLNWTMLIAKFQWDAQTGEVRLSAVENTDSNFDRRAFRSTVQALHNKAGQLFRELDALIRGSAAPAVPAHTTAPAGSAAPQKTPAKAPPGRGPAKAP